jgi:hypothetical protein
MCVSWTSGSITCNPTNSGTGDIQSFSLSAGNYELRSYVRGCNGNCGGLGEPEFECRQNLSLKSGETLYIRRDPSSTSCTLTSTPTSLQVLGAANLSGRILHSDGTPAVAVRIGAIRRQDVNGPIIPFKGTQSDIDGQFLLENVPEGDYYLAVFEKNQKTFYPGVTAQATAAVISVRSGQGTGRYDFSIPAR